MNLTKYERETIILFNEAEDTAEVSTYNRRLQHRLDHLAKEHPGEVKRTKRGACGYTCYTLPKRLIAIHKPYSDERTDSGRIQAILPLRTRTKARHRDIESGGGGKHTTPAAIQKHPAKRPDKSIENFWPTPRSWPEVAALWRTSPAGNISFGRSFTCACPSMN